MDSGIKKCVKYFVANNSITTTMVLLVFFVDYSTCLSQERKTTMLNLNEPIRENWLNKSQIIKDKSFVNIKPRSKLAYMQLYESKAIMEFFLKKEFDPYRSGVDTRWSAYAAEQGGIDFIRGIYEAQHHNFVITESRNFIVVNVTPDKETQHKITDKKKYLKNFISTVVKTYSSYHNWTFTLPDDLTTSWDKRLITNTGAPPIEELESRDDRVDIVTFERTVYFIFYKKIAQLEDFRPADQWFDPEDRAYLLKEQKNRITKQ